MQVQRLNPGASRPQTGPAPNPRSTYATPCSRTNLVTVAFGFLGGAGFSFGSSSTPGKPVKAAHSRQADSNTNPGGFKDMLTAYQQAQGVQNNIVRHTHEVQPRGPSSDTSSLAAALRAALMEAGVVGESTGQVNELLTSLQKINDMQPLYVQRMKDLEERLKASDNEFIVNQALVADLEQEIAHLRSSLAAALEANAQLRKEMVRDAYIEKYPDAQDLLPLRSVDTPALGLPAASSPGKTTSNGNGNGNGSNGAHSVAEDITVAFANSNGSSNGNGAGKAPHEVTASAGPVINASANSNGSSNGNGVLSTSNGAGSGPQVVVQRVAGAPDYMQDPAHPGQEYDTPPELIAKEYSVPAEAAVAVQHGDTAPAPAAVAAAPSAASTDVTPVAAASEPPVASAATPAPAPSAPEAMPVAPTADTPAPPPAAASAVVGPAADAPAVAAATPQPPAPVAVPPAPTPEAQPEAQPAPQQEKRKQIVLKYRTGWGQAFLHCNVDGKGWTNTPGIKLQNSGEDAKEKQIVIDGNSLEFVVNNGHNDWDTPAPSSANAGPFRNYRISEPGTYRLHNGTLVRQ